MFSRSADRSAPPGTAPAPGARDALPPPVPHVPGAPQVAATVIGRADRFEGTLRVAELLRVLGQVEGRIEAATLVVEEGARVAADVVADDVLIAGDYQGRLTCRGRLEVRPGGRVAGQLEASRLLLHDGAAVDGELKMLRPPGDAEPGRSAGPRAGAPESGLRGGTGIALTPRGMPPGADPIG